MSWLCFSFFNVVMLLLCNLSFIGSSGTTLPIRCEYPCQPAPSPPLYGNPPPSQQPPPIEPVYGSPPPPKQPPNLPPSEPVYEAPPQPKVPSCEPPPAAPLPTTPVYGMPAPPQQPGICQPPMQYCVYPPPTPNQDFYQPFNSACYLSFNSLQILVLMFLIFLHF